MKRIIAAFMIVCLILSVSAYSIWQFYQLRQEAIPLLEQMRELCDAGDLSSVQGYAEKFQDLWEEYQPDLSRFTRRDPLEHMGKCAARLSALAEYGDAADFSATVDELSHCLEQLWQSELPDFKQLF